MSKRVSHDDVQIKMSNMVADMTEALENVGLCNLFVAAKKHSSRSIVLELGRIAHAFASKYAELDCSGRDAFRQEYPGVAGRRYKYGWMGQWARLVDSDPEAAGDNALSPRTMVRCLKFLPIANELAERDRMDAIPLKLGASCAPLQKALSRIDPPHGQAPNPSETKVIVKSVADAFIASLDQIKKPLNASAAHATRIGDEIRKACASESIDLGEDDSAETSRKRKRDTDNPQEDSRDLMLDKKIAALIEDRGVRDEVTRRLEAMIPEVARVVAREQKSRSDVLVDPLSSAWARDSMADGTGVVAPSPFAKYSQAMVAAAANVATPTSMLEVNSAGEELESSVSLEGGAGGGAGGSAETGGAGGRGGEAVSPTSDAISDGEPPYAPAGP